jgi:hypothetical protein
MFNKFALFTLTLAVLVGCGSNDNNDEARLRVFHASPDAPNVDVQVDGGSVLENVPYTTASDFIDLSAGTVQLTVTAAGTNLAVIDAQLDLAHNTDYMVVAAGKLAEIAPIVTTVDRSAPPTGAARIRVLHSAASAPAVDVYVTAPGVNIEAAEPVLSDVPFKAISDYLPVPAGSYDVTVTVAGTTNIAIQALNLNISEGLVATVAALDNAGGGAPFALKVLDERNN